MKSIIHLLLSQLLETSDPQYDFYVKNETQHFLNKI